MQEGEAAFEELRRAGWVDPAVGLDELMAGLADGRSVGSLLSVDRGRPSFSVLLTRGEGRLVAELTAIARRPYLAMEPPTPPSLGLERLAADFGETTGRSLELRLRWDGYPSGGRWLCDAVIDGRAAGGVGPVGAVRVASPTSPTCCASSGSTRRCGAAGRSAPATRPDRCGRACSMA